MKIIYINIYIKSDATYFGLNNHNQGACQLSL
jgi:hypothetical protein